MLKLIWIMYKSLVSTQRKHSLYIMKFIWLIMSRRVNVCVVIRLQARQWRFGIQLSGGGDTAFYPCVQTDSVAHPAFCPIGNGGFFWRGYIVGACKVKNPGIMPVCHSCWCAYFIQHSTPLCSPYCDSQLNITYIFWTHVITTAH